VTDCASGSSGSGGTASSAWKCRAPGNGSVASGSTGMEGIGRSSSGCSSCGDTSAGRSGGLVIGFRLEKRPRGSLVSRAGGRVPSVDRLSRPARCIPRAMRRPGVLSRIHAPPHGRVIRPGGTRPRRRGNDIGRACYPVATKQDAISRKRRGRDRCGRACRLHRGTALRAVLAGAPAGRRAEGARRTRILPPPARLRKPKTHPLEGLK